MSPRRKMPANGKIERAPRASVTFPPEIYHSLEDLAKQKKVSIAWVVREAAEKYVAEEAVRTAGSHSDQRRRQSSR